MKFARVIPCLRTPLGIEGFDYRVPEGQAYAPGALVTVPFRRQSVVGIISALLDDSQFSQAAKTIQARYADLDLPSALIPLITWTARSTFSSAPTILKSWLRELPKKPLSIRAASTSAVESGLAANWSCDYTRALLDRAQAHSVEGRTLIVTPWIARATYLHSQLPQALILHSAQSPGLAFHNWTQFLSCQRGCLITTKIGAWLATGSTLVLLDEPEQDDHKQDELAPRYDARKVVIWCAQHGHTRVDSFGLTPPLHTRAAAPSIPAHLEIFPHHPQGRSVIPCVQADALARLLEHEGQRIILHPVRGLYARIICRDCSWQATCSQCQFPLGAVVGRAVCRLCHHADDMPEFCQRCGGLDLAKSIPGLDRLQAVWQKNLPHESITWRDTTNEQLEAPFPPECLLLVTNLGWLGTGEDVRKRERLCLIFRRLLNRIREADGRLLLQCDESLASSIKTWTTSDGMLEFMATEYQDRQQFGYPPTTRVVKIILNGSLEQARVWQARAASVLERSRLTTLGWRGPWPVEYRPKNRADRSILHLVMPVDTPESRLLDCLPSLVKPGVIIDLDPIAFLH